jgi:hypothetical protein
MSEICIALRLARLGARGVAGGGLEPVNTG